MAQSVLVAACATEIRTMRWNGIDRLRVAHFVFIFVSHPTQLSLSLSSLFVDETPCRKVTESRARPPKDAGVTMAIGARARMHLHSRPPARAVTARVDQWATQP